jgi:hypothetical protein
LHQSDQPASNGHRSSDYKLGGPVAPLLISSLPDFVRNGAPDRFFFSENNVEKSVRVMLAAFDVAVQARSQRAEWSSHRNGSLAIRDDPDRNTPNRIASTAYRQWLSFRKGLTSGVSFI